jgi:cell wall integrity and stress response component
LIPIAGGGANYWFVYLTGITRNHIANLDPSSLTKSSSTSGPTVVVTASGSAKGGSNTVGIAVGVVVGIVVLAGIAGGVFFWLRFKRVKEESDEYKRQNDMNAFVNGGKPGYGNVMGPGSVSPPDSRLDPDALQRRQSTGSIADNQDYSRRILTVCLQIFSRI